MSDERPWGWKATATFYFKGEPTHERIRELMDRVGLAYDDSVFAGVKIETVEVEPSDQVAT